MESVKMTTSFRWGAVLVVLVVEIGSDWVLDGGWVPF